ncbi:MAG TPA: DoxX family protein, partial [Blastocatellia bacterium]|nr:DoxX family protein [Blastocatellia bacterium]
CYDVPVKLFSLHLLVVSIFLIAPDLKRLANIFIFNRAAEAGTFPVFFERKWLNRGVLALQIVFGLYLIGSSLHEGYKGSNLYGEGAPKPPLYGIWMVEEFSVDGQLRPPLLTDAPRWQRVIFQNPGALTIQPMSGPNQRFKLELDMENKTLSLGKQDDPDWKAGFSFEVRAPGLITVEGEMEGHKTTASLARFDESKFLLRNRGFHWIQEYPFNR